MHDARNVANEFIQRALDDGKPLTPLQVQKLLYFAHAWMLAIHGRPLLMQLFEVWRYGPVVPLVYYCLSHYRGDPITEPLPVHRDSVREFDPTERSVIDQVYEKYGHLSGLKLSNLCHASGGPWDQMNRAYKRYIPDELLESYYKQFLRKAG